MPEEPTKKAGRPKKAPEEKGRHVKVWLPAALERRLRAKHVRPGEPLSEAIRRLLQAATPDD